MRKQSSPFCAESKEQRTGDCGGTASILVFVGDQRRRHTGLLECRCGRRGWGQSWQSWQSWGVGGRQRTQRVLTLGHDIVVEQEVRVVVQLVGLGHHRYVHVVVGGHYQVGCDVARDHLVYVHSIVIVSLDEELIKAYAANEMKLLLFYWN